MTKRWHELSLSALLLCACASAGASERDAPAGGLPTPYTQDEIQDGNRPGTTRVYLISQAGAEPVLQTTRFLPDDAGQARFENLSADLAGKPVAERTERHATWGELQGHANFSAADTVLSPASCTTAAGVFQGSLYVRTEAPAAPGAAPVVHRFWFSADLPGPPALYEMTRGDELLYRMELVELQAAPR
jgi:hypothetical protein